MVIIEEHIAPSLEAPSRLSDYLIGKLQLINTRKGVKTAIKRGEVWLEGKKGNTGDWVKGGEKIQLMEAKLIVRKVFPMEFPVVFEDDYIAIINKPSGIPVSGNLFRTIENALPNNIQPSSQTDKLPFARAAHRLDAPTSGLLIIAKTRKARVELGRMFEAKTIHKIYQAIVIGEMANAGTIDFPIEDKASLTIFKNIKTIPSVRNQHLSLVELQPKTGRTHQLRIHLSQLGFPIMGDKLYGTEGNIIKGKGLFLSSVGLAFEHPITGEKLEFTVNPPNKFDRLLNWLGKMTE
jgi:23S rRNA pseudouridine1911/1915/1917 synthase